MILWGNYRNTISHGVDKKCDLITYWPEVVGEIYENVRDFGFYFRNSYIAVVFRKDK